MNRYRSQNLTHSTEYVSLAELPPPRVVRARPVRPVVSSSSSNLLGLTSIAKDLSIDKAKDAGSLGSNAPTILYTEDYVPNPEQSSPPIMNFVGSCRASCLPS